MRYVAQKDAEMRYLEDGATMEQPMSVSDPVDRPMKAKVV